MTTETLTLAGFLLERIADDGAYSDMLHVRDCDLALHGSIDPNFGWECTCAYPARVLAECAAKRAIVEMHEFDSVGWCITCDQNPTRNPCDTLNALVAVYANHPDFNRDWA